MRNTTLTLIAGAAMSTSLAFAQGIPFPGPEPQIFEFRTISSESFGGKVITGAPFSAEETTTTTQLLLDGNRIINTSKSKVYRDQQGRTRTESTLGNIGGLPASESKVSTTIDDPVTGTHYVLNPSEQTAFKMSTLPPSSETDSLERLQKMTAEIKARNSAEVRALTRVEAGTSIRTEGGGTSNFVYTQSRSMEKPAKTEDLGTQNMEGVQAKGTRSTTTIPSGAMGNDREINIVTERWYSPELQMNIMTKRTDPRMGETVFQVTNLVRSNPDASLFAPPADYQIKDGPKAGAFTKAITIQK
jgi:hypothetical protein